MIIPRHHIKESNLVSDLIHDSQYQPVGVDLTIKSAHNFLNAGKLDFDNLERKTSDCKEILLQNDEFLLKKGTYKIIFNEYVRIPHDSAAFCFPRSSLLRCGATLNCAVWDPGYEGRSESLLVVHNDHGLILKKNAKIGQLVFIKLIDAAKTLYEGVYKGENK